MICLPVVFPDKNDDISMHFKLLENGDFGNIPTIVFKYRRVMNSVTHRSPKKAYFLALAVRINAIIKHSYRPAIINTLLVIPETILVSLLPNQKVLDVFEFLRFTHDQAMKIWRFGASIPAAALAKVAGIIVLSDR